MLLLSAAELLLFELKATFAWCDVTAPAASTAVWLLPPAAAVITDAACIGHATMSDTAEANSFADQFLATHRPDSEVICYFCHL